MLPENLHSIDNNPPTRFWQKISLVAEISHLCRRITPDSPSWARVLQHIQQIVPFDLATLHLRRDPDTALRPSACVGDPVGIPAFLMAESAPDGIERPSEQPMLLTRRDDRTDELHAEFGGLLYVPLMVDGVAWGALVLASYRKDVLTEQHLKLMSIVADQLAVSLERVNYISAIESKNEDLRLAQDELRANQKRIVAAERLAEAARLAASINHQINNPLAVILGHVQCLLLEQRNLGEKTFQRLNRIEQAAQRIANVNRDLLRLDDPTLANSADHFKTLDQLVVNPEEIGMRDV